MSKGIFFAQTDQERDNSQYPCAPPFAIPHQKSVEENAPKLPSRQILLASPTKMALKGGCALGEK